MTNKIMKIIETLAAVSLLLAACAAPTTGGGGLMPVVAPAQNCIAGTNVLLCVVMPSIAVTQQSGALIFVQDTPAPTSQGFTVDTPIPTEMLNPTLQAALSATPSGGISSPLEGTFTPEATLAVPTFIAHLEGDTDGDGDQGNEKQPAETVITECGTESNQLWSVCRIVNPVDGSVRTITLPAGQVNVVYLNQLDIFNGTYVYQPEVSNDQVPVSSHITPTGEETWMAKADETRIEETLKALQVLCPTGQVCYIKLSAGDDSYTEIQVRVIDVELAKQSARIGNKVLEEAAAILAENGVELDNVRFILYGSCSTGLVQWGSDCDAMIVVETAPGQGYQIMNIYDLLNSPEAKRRIAAATAAVNGPIKEININLYPYLQGDHQLTKLDPLYINIPMDQAGLDALVPIDVPNTMPARYVDSLGG